MATAKQQMKDRVKESIGSSGRASMIPAAPEPVIKMPDEVPTMESIIKKQEDRDRISMMVAEYTAIQQEYSMMEKKKEKLSAQLKIELMERDIKQMLCFNYKVTMFPTSRSTIDKEMLLSNGVAPSIIEASTKVSSSVSMKITEVKG